MELVEIKGSDMPMHTLTPDVKLEAVKAIMKYLIEIIGVDVSKHPLKLARVEQMIEENARRMTPTEIKKAFDLYVKGNLSGLEPTSGLLDSITFNKVVTAYRQQKQPEKHEPIKLDISEDEKQQNAFLNIVYAFDDWVGKKEVSYEFHTAYDELKTRGFLETPTKEESKKIMEKSKSRLIRESATNRSLKESLRSVLGTKNERDWVINYGKCELLSRFFKTVHEQKKHIKDLI